MKSPISLLLLLLLAFSPFVVTQNSTVLLSIDSLPPCASECLVTAIATSSCRLMDQECICTNAPLQSNIEACVLQSCTVKDELSTKNITMTACGAPVRDKSRRFKITNLALGALSSAVVLIRLTSKIVVSGADPGLDDYTILITAITSIPGIVINDQGMVKNGLGKDVWTLEPTHIANFVRLLYVMELLYFAQLTLLKLSLLLFYRRIFPGVNVKHVILTTIVLNIVFGMIFIIVGIFQCQPISFFWNSWDGEHSGKCININALGWANAAISIVLDIWMLVIPLSQLAHLKLAWKKKVGVGLMFGVGSFVTVVSILRLRSLTHLANSQNPTWDQWDVINWSNMEINIGITCACMPAIRALLVRLFPKALGTDRNTSNQYHKHGKFRNTAMGKGATLTSSTLSGLGGTKNAIYCTSAFEVQQGDRDGDEIALVGLDDISGEASIVKIGNSSHINS